MNVSASDLISGASLLVSLFALYQSSKSRKTDIKTFQRQGVIDLHGVWGHVHGIDPANPKTEHIVEATNVLTLTAALWNHDIVEKTILYQCYWISYKALYESLFNCHVVVPRLNKKGCECLSPEITKVYDQMKAMEINGVKQTTVN